MAERHTVKSLHERLAKMESIADDICKIKTLIKWIGPSIIAALVANGIIDEKWGHALQQIGTALGAGT